MSVKLKVPAKGTSSTSFAKKLTNTPKAKKIDKLAEPKQRKNKFPDSHLSTVSPETKSITKSIKKLNHSNSHIKNISDAVDFNLPKVEVKSFLTIEY
jgi:hypothetical protein